MTIPGGYCRDCRWWQPPAQTQTTPAWGWCAFNFDRTRFERSPLFHTNDLLSTKPDFGCVQWERKAEALQTIQDATGLAVTADAVHAAFSSEYDHLTVREFRERFPARVIDNPKPP